MKGFVYSHTFIIHSAASTISDLDISKKKGVHWTWSLLRHHVPTHLSAWTAMMRTLQMMTFGPHFWTKSPSENFEPGRALLFWDHKRSILRANWGQWVSSIHPFFATLRKSIQVYLQTTAVCTQNNRSSLTIPKVNYIYTRAEDICNYMFIHWLFIYLTILYDLKFFTVSKVGRFVNVMLEKIQESSVMAYFSIVFHVICRDW
jgi:hypothetical protein